MPSHDGQPTETFTLRPPAPTVVPPQMVPVRPVPPNLSPLPVTAMISPRLSHHLALLLCAASLALPPLRAWQADNRDGTFNNPPLNADYPDPDIVRVGDDFYFVTTTFVNSPGLRLLHSKDLVHWEITGHILPRLDGRREYDLENGGDYRHGFYAASLRHHNGLFYVAVTPVSQNTRIYTASDPKGPWSCHTLDRAAFDPGLFFDNDGTGYIATSGSWDGTIQLLKLSPDFTSVVDARKIHFIKGAEGSKLVRRGEWYYLFNSIPSRLAMTVSRSKNLYGPWETREQIDDRTGGHQGALVDLPDGNWFGFVMRDAGAIGRVTNLSPVFWQDDWPVWGTPDQPGHVPARTKNPLPAGPDVQPATSDNFDRPVLGLQWAWNHNPDDSRWSLSERPGWLRLRPTRAGDVWTARNTLTQKGQGPWSRGDVKLDLSRLRPGDVCGFGTLGKFSGHLAVSCLPDGTLTLSMNVVESTREGPKTSVRAAAEPLHVSEIWLRTEMDFRSDTARCSYSLDGSRWLPLGGDFPLAYDWQTGTFQGPQYAVFCFNANPGDGCVDVDFFSFADSPQPARP